MNTMTKRSASNDEMATKSLLEALPVALIVVDKALHIQLVNAAAEQLLGLSSGFLLGQNLYDLIDEDAAIISQNN